jgi:O-antigen/teichoic acid export membrane protein
MRGLFGHDSIYLGLQALQIGVAALSIPITTRLLGGTGFGIVTTSIVLMQLVVQIGSFGLPTGVQRVYRANDDGDARRVVTLTCLTAGVTFAVAWASGPYWARWLGLGSFDEVLQCAVIWAAMTAVTFTAVGLLRSRNQLFAYGLVSFLQSLVAEVFSVLLLVFVHRSAAEFVLGETIAQAVALAVALGATRPLVIRRRHLAKMRGALKYSAALVPGAVAGLVLISSDRLIIRHDLPILQVARYGAVYNIASIPVLLLALLDTVWLPRFFALSHDDRVLSRLLTDSRDALYRMLIPAVLAMSLCMPLFLSVWLKASYHPAGLVLVVVTISATGFPMAGFLSANRVLLVSGRTAVLAPAEILTAAVNVALNIVLVPADGIEGAAIATLLAYLFRQALFAVLAGRVRKLRRPSPMLILACATGMMAAVLLTQAPTAGVFAYARVAAAVASLLVWASMLRALVSPQRGPWTLRARRTPIGRG